MLRCNEKHAKEKLSVLVTVLTSGKYSNKNFPVRCFNNNNYNFLYRPHYIRWHHVELFM